MRNAWVLLLLSALLVFGSVTVAHSYTIRRLTNNHIADWNASMNDRGHVVWERANAGIFLYNGSTVTQLTQETHPGYNPDINNKGHVVWEEFKYNLEDEEFVSDIILYDGMRSRRITDNAYDDISPQINNKDQVVWQGYKDNDWEIFLYDGTAIRQISNNSYNNINQQINDNGSVVWEGSDGEDSEIFLYDGTTVRQLTDNSHDDMNPQINRNGYVVWEGYDGNDWEIFLYDGVNITQLTNNDYDDMNPNINGKGNVVWKGHSDDDWHIFLYNGQTVTQLTGGYDDYELRVRINDSGYVAWNNYSDIFVFDGYDIVCITEEFHRFMQSSGLQINNRGHIIWQSGEFVDDASGEIFLATPPELALVSPNGGEVFASDSVQTIQWKVAEADLSFNLFYSIDNKVTWEPIDTGITGSSYNWTIPAPTRNSKECFVRVVAYRASGLRVGADVSDEPFSIESVTLMTPNHWGIYLNPGESYDITWEIHETVKPVETVELYYTRNSMAIPVVWEPIATFGVNEYPGVYSWQVPDVTQTRRHCKVKVVLKDAESKRVGMVVSDSYFAIQFLNAENEWIYVGPQGAIITKLVFDPLQPHVLYAAGYGGSLFKTIDGGKNWESLNNGIEDLRMQSLAIDPSNSGTLYVGDTMYKGIYKSTDYAQSWFPVSPLDGDFNPYIWDLVIDPLKSNTLYAGGQGGIYKTADGGESWNRMSAGIPPGPYGTLTDVVSLAIDPVNPNILYAGTYHQNGLYKSTDGGETWRIANMGMEEWYGDVPSVLALAINPSNTNVLYAGTYNPDDGHGIGVFKSTDGGENWILVNPERLFWKGVVSLVIDPLRPNTVYSGNIYGEVFKTTDAGEHWKLMDKRLDDIWYIMSLAIDPRDHHTVFAATALGVFRIHESHGHITVKPIFADFGDVLEGGILKKTITVGNSGPRGLILGAISDPAGSFRITGSTCGPGKVLVPGATCKITVQFAPHTPGSFTSSFTIASDDTDNPSVTVNLSGALGTIETK